MHAIEHVLNIILVPRVSLLLFPWSYREREEERPWGQGCTEH